MSSAFCKVNSVSSFSGSPVHDDNMIKQNNVFAKYKNKVNIIVGSTSGQIRMSLFTIFADAFYSEIIMFAYLNNKCREIFHNLSRATENIKIENLGSNVEIFKKEGVNAHAKDILYKTSRKHFYFLQLSITRFLSSNF